MPFKPSPHVSTSYSDWLVLPGKVTRETTIENISLRSRLTSGLYMPFGLLSAAMQCVTNDVLSIALAEYGGLGVLPRSLSVEDQAEMVRRVKRYRSGFVFDVMTVSPDDNIGKLIELEQACGFSTYPVVEEVEGGRRLVGVITEKRYHPEKDLNVPVRKRMIRMGDGLVYGKDGITLDKANDMMCASGVGVLPIVDRKGCLVSAVFYNDLKKHVMHPNAFIDGNKSLMVFGAVSTFSEDYERAEELVKAGANGLVIDIANAWTEFTPDAIKAYKAVKPAMGRHRRHGVPLIVGNIVTADAFRELADWGADCVKIGHGPGAGCTTRVKKRTGWGQATAVLVCSDARDRYYRSRGRYVPVCADGGINDTGDMGVAFACGADTVMAGKYLGQYTEGASPLVHKRFRIGEVGGEPQEVSVPVKLYWGEASPRAMNLARYGHTTRKTFVVEGDEGHIFHAGSIHDNLPQEINTLKSTFSGWGCKDIPAVNRLRRQGRLELQTSGAAAEGRTRLIT
jgi:IMP dehydrogenase